jgi:prepilin-type N-terminal cleavage/methylation domain-containing protein
MTRNDMRAAATHPRRGYTAIELLIVLGIVSIITTMAVPAIVPAMRKGRVNDGINAILHVSRQARILAMQNPPPADGRHYGVAIFDDPDSDKTPVVALIFGSPSDGKDDRGRILTGGDGKPVAKQAMSAAVEVWSGEKRLRDGAKIVTWYFEYQSGVPISTDDTGFSTSPVNVGVPDVALTNVWGLIGNDISVPSVSPGTASVPGLSVRTADNSIRRALALYVSGQPVTGEF